MEKENLSGNRLETGPWLDSRSQLSPDQLKAVMMSREGDCLVLGAAGTGKTQALLLRGAYLAETFRVPAERYRLFVLNEMAAEFIKPGLRLLGLPEEAAVPFDRWCRLFHEKHIPRELPRVYVNLRPDFPKIRMNVLQVLDQDRSLRHGLDFALVDDGQDLAPEGFEILKLAAKHVTVFADFRQQMAEDRTSADMILRVLGQNVRKEELSGIFRNARHVAHLASSFISDKDFRREFLSQVTRNERKGERPLFFTASSEEKELDHLAAFIQMRHSSNESVCIFVPSSGQLHVMSRELHERGVGVEKVIESDAQNVLHGPYDFEDKFPKIATYHAAKGLAFDSVFMPRLTENSFASFKNEDRERMLFVGAARARHWAYLSTVRGNEFQEIRFLKEAEAGGHLLMV
jgi:superfamily I DNA/RNA helicase